MLLARFSRPGRSFVLLALIGLLLSSWASAQSALGRGDWWMFQHDPQHTGRSAYVGPEVPERKWGLPIGESVDSAPAVGMDGTIYSGSEFGLLAIDADGTQQWAFPAGNGIGSSPALAADGTIYIGSADGHLYAVNPDGTQRWAFLAGNSIGSPAIGADGTIYINSAAGSLYAINPDGTQQWAFQADGSALSSPALGADGTIYVGSATGKLYAITPTGTQHWVSPAGSGILTSPTIGADGTIYVGSDDHSLYAMKPDGTPKWAFATGDRIDATPALGADGTIYISSYDHSLYALNADGTQKWAFSTGNILRSTPAVGADGTLYLLADDGHVYAINPDGTQRWIWAIGVFSRPFLVLSQGGMFIVSTSRALNAVGNASPALTLTNVVTPPNALPGSAVQYTLTYKNTGGAATGLVLTDPLPAHLTYIADSATDGGSYDAATRTLTWTWDTLGAVAGVRAVTFRATVDADTPLNTTLANTASLTCTEMTTPLSSTASLRIVAPQRGDWWMFQHDPQHTGRSAFTGPEVPAVKWSFAPAEQVYMDLAPVFAADGTIYATASDRCLHAINPDGTQKWAVLIGDYIAVSPTVAMDGTIYVGTYFGTFTAINPDGTPQWSIHLDSCLISPPNLGTDGTIYLTTDDGKLYALNPDGTTKWTFANANEYYVSPAIGVDGTIYVGSSHMYVGSSNNHLYALNPDGTQKWVCPIWDITASPIVGTDGTIYIMTWDSNLTAISSDGVIKWTMPIGGFINSVPSLGEDDTIYVCLFNTLYAINPDGTIKWTFPTWNNDGISASAIGADGTIYVGSSNDGTLYALNPDGTLKWFDQNGFSYPTIGAGGTLYAVRWWDGKLYAINNPSPAVSFANTVNPVNALPGSTVEYTLTCRNTDNMAVTNALLTDPLPAHLSYVPDSASDGGVYDAATRTLTWTLGTLHPGDPARALTFQATVDADAPLNTTLSNTAALSFAEMFTPVRNTAGLYIGAPQRGDWWMFHHDAQHTGRSPFTGPSIPAVKWAYPLGGPIFSSPALGADGAIYTRSSDGNLVALNPDGTARWSVYQYCWIDPSPAIGTDGAIYAGTYDGRFLAYNPDGTLKWAVDTDGGITAGATIGVDGTIYVGTMNGTLYAFNPNGTVQWTFTALGSIQTAPAIGADGTIYVGNGYLYAIHPDGTQKWYYPIGSTVESSPTVGTDGTIYVGADDGRLCAITPYGTLKWAFSTGDRITSSPAIGADGAVFVGSNDHFLYAINPDGTPRWAFPTGDCVSSSPAVDADGTVYVGSWDKNLYAINADGTLKWALPLLKQIVSSPAIGADGTVYVGGYDGNLYAIGQSLPLTLTKSVSPTRALPGDLVTYTLSYGNTGVGATNILLTDPLPAHLTYLDGSATDGGAYDLATRTLTWSPGKPPVGQTGTVSFMATVDADAPLKTTIPNTAAISCAEMPTPLASNPAFLYVGDAQSGDWWMFHHDAQHTGRSAFTGPREPYLKWTAHTGDFASPAISADGTIYTVFGCSLWATNPDGTVKWSFPLDGCYASSPAIGVDGTIYVGGNNDLFAINPDGTPRWAFRTGRTIYSSPTLGVDGTIYFGESDGILYALNPDGTEKWAFAANNIESCPALGADGTVYIGAYDHKLYALNPDGSLKWAFTTGGIINSSPAIGADGTVYFGSNDGKLYAINPDGTQQWAFATGDEIISTPALGADGRIYVGSYDHNLYALNPNGTLQWAFPTGGWLFSSPAVGADGTVYVGSSDKNLYAVNADGTLQWCYPVADTIYTSPALGADGTVYCCTYYYLYAIGNPPHDMPTLDRIPDQTVLENAGPTTLPLTGISAGDANDAWQTITITATSSNPTIIPNPVISYTSPDATGTLTFQPVTEQTGTAKITVTVQDNGDTANGGVNTLTRTFTVTVAAVNDAPTLDPLPDLTLYMSPGLQTVNLTGISAGDADDAGQHLYVTAISDTSTLILNPDVSYTNPQATGAITFTPKAGATGTAHITVTVHDGGGTANGGVDTFSRTFTVKVISPNHAPTLNTPANLTCYENAGPQTVNLSGIGVGSVEDAGQTLTITASSSNTALIPTPTVSYTSPATTGTLTLQPVTGQAGTATITVTVQDDGGTAHGGVDTTTRQFTVTVTAPNDAPTLDPLPDLTYYENCGARTVNLTGISAGDADDAGQVITITATSDNTPLIPNPTVSYTSPRATGTLTVTPVTEAIGTAHITVTVRDNGGTGGGGVNTLTRTFTVTVTPVNDAPTLGTIINKVVRKNAGVQTITLTGISAGDADDAGQAITITATSSNTALVPNPTISYTSPAATGTLTYQPAPDQIGSAVITVKVQDDGGTANGGVDTMTRQFTVSVVIVNSAPTLDPLPDLALCENAGTQTVNLTGISVGSTDDAGQTITITAASDKTALIPTPVVTYTSPQASGTLTLAPVTEATGTAHITVTVKDSGGTANGGVNTTTRTFTVTVTPVNDPPTISSIANVLMAMNSGSKFVQPTGISPGDADDNGQALTVTAASSNPALMPDPAVSYTSPNSSALLTLTPVVNQYGTTTITVTVKDNGGTANGGVDTTVRTFTVTVATTPTAKAGTLTTNQDTPAALTLSATDPLGLPLTYTLATNPAHGTLTYAAGGSASGTLSSPALVYTPAAGYRGTDALTFTVSNGVLASTAATVNITVYGKPTAGTTTLSTNQETPLTITLSGSDPLGLPLTGYTLATQPAHGTLTDKASGLPASGALAGLPPVLVYTPNTGFHDVDTFTFTVTNGYLTSTPGTVSITVWGIPRANAQTVKAAINTPLPLTLTGSDPLGLPITYALASTPAHGTLTYTASGLSATGTLSSPNLTYTPATGYKGADAFTFTTSNGHLTSAVATVSLTVYAKPTAGTTTLTTNQETPLTYTLTGNDPGKMPLTAYTLVSGPKHGTLTYLSTGTPAFVGTLFGVPPTLVYTPAAGFHDVDTFTFTVTNGVLTSDPATVSITVFGRPTAYAKSVGTGPDMPVNVTLTGTDPLGLTITGYTLTSLPAHGTLTATATGLPVSGTVTNPNLTYTPAPGFLGAVDTFTYTVSNGHMDSKPATVSLTVYGKPTAGTTTLTTNQETPLPLTLTGSDRFGLPLSNYTLVTLPAHGTLTYTATGQPVTTGLLTSRNLTYTPAVGFHDVDKFTFTTSNGYLTSDPATVSITVFGKPTARAQSVTTSGGAPIALTLTGSDPLGLPLTAYTLATLPAHGTLTDTATGLPVSLGTLTSPALTFTPTPGYKGTDAFTFTVSNGHLTSSAGTVSLTVN